MEIPEGAEREWFFYEGLKKLSKVRKDEEQEALQKLKEQFFVDYADHELD